MRNCSALWELSADQIVESWTVLLPSAGPNRSIALLLQRQIMPASLTINAGQSASCSMKGRSRFIAPPLLLRRVRLLLRLLVLLFPFAAQIEHQAEDEAEADPISALQQTLPEVTL